MQDHFIFIVSYYTLGHINIATCTSNFMQWKEDNVAFCNESPVKGNIYAALAFIDHLYASLVRSAMAYVTILVVEILLVDDKCGGEYEKHKLALQLFYNFFAFFFLFVCGSLMNRYHTNYRKYQESQKRKILSTSCDKYIMLLMQSSTSSVRFQNTSFLIPTIFSIDFPLNSPGYTLTISLSLFVFIENFVTQYR